MAFGGSLLTSFHDASNTNNDGNNLNQNQLWGDVAGLVSAIGYGG
eukprot:CAMPEP_0197255064 /NCGR_PEP_ID=MMETSP1429-20130617/70896_1 /TAXON_ID=49237 /ORGANISM="Chaetoceros  sp., Strain UNC1202" /LENGTH=44 /DNA_ID= /DNA_START= /DNA_END= /DNA_ORIENTATION=